MHEILSQLNVLFQSMGLPGLALNAFIESFFLTPPLDILLITLDLAKPDKALYYASIATLCSAVGGFTGYLIGRFGGRPVFNFIFRKKQEQFNSVEALYEKYGTFAVIFSAFTPIPYNVFTIASGILNMNPAKFFVASVFGRGMRFFLVSTVLMIFGEMIKAYIHHVIIAVTIIIIIFFVILYKKRNALK